MERMTVKQAAQLLHINEIGVRVLLQQGRLPIGYAVQRPNSTRFTYYVFRELTEAYVKKVESGEL